MTLPRSSMEEIVQLRKREKREKKLISGPEITLSAIDKSSYEEAKSL